MISFLFICMYDVYYPALGIKIRSSHIAVALSVDYFKANTPRERWRCYLKVNPILVSEYKNLCEYDMAQPAFRNQTNLGIEFFLVETKCRPTSQVGKSDKTNCRWQHLRKRILHLILHMVIKENKSDYLMNASMHYLKNLCSIWKQVTCQKSPTEIEWRESKPKKNWDCYHLCCQTLESSWSKNSHSDLPGIKNEEGRIKSSCNPHLKMEIYLESSRTLASHGGGFHGN